MIAGEDLLIPCETDLFVNYFPRVNTIWNIIYSVNTINTLP